MTEEVHEGAGHEAGTIDAIVERLRDVYTREGVAIWLHARNRDLDGRRPIDLLRAGHLAAVDHAIERLRTGAM